MADGGFICMTGAMPRDFASISELPVPSGFAARLLDGRRLPVAWALAGSLLLGAGAMLVAFRARFDWARELADIPALALAAGLIAAGLVYLAVLPLVRATELADRDMQKRCFGFVLVVGLLLRGLMFATEPALEDDHHRYLWEGAAAAHGFSPYALSPHDAKIADRRTELGRLAEAAGPVLERVNHPHLKTIYPPVAMTVFTVAHWIAPYSLAGWRLVLFGCEMASLLLILLLLKDLGRARIWAALYWWNPIAIKEIMNSGHMEGALVPLMLLATWLVVRRKPLAATGALGLAVGVKVWPLLLAPVLLRAWWGNRAVLLTVGVLLGGLCGLWALPILLGGLDRSSGFVAYAQEWQANSASLPAVREMIRGLVAPLGFAPEIPGRLARLLLAAVAAAFALGLALRPIASPSDLVRRVSLVTLVMVLASPAQFPWYLLWTMPFLPFAPRLGVLAMAVLVPLYYTSFHFAALGAFAIFRDRIVWVIWLPIWVLLASEAFARWQRRRATIPGSMNELAS